MVYRSSQPPPSTLGRYRVVRRVGAGGMAEVFLAKSAGAEGIEKVLVVKRILPTFARSVKFITMFVDEAKVAMRLNHPNIVQVYAFEQVRDEFLLAMEFVDGSDLGRLVATASRQGERLPYGLAAFIVMDAAKGLEYAHNRKDEGGDPMEIVHRDVSPQNLLLSYEGAVKVTDFGIARARLVSEETGVIKGKFSYMSPEQARGERVDRRSDVYSLGVLLAELLMGRPMYPGQQGLDVLEQVRLGKIVLPRQVDPSVPKELDEIVREATCLDREKRFQSSRALATALAQCLHNLDEVYDGAALERFIAGVMPRELTSPDAASPSVKSADPSTADTQVSAEIAIPRELRERRHVVVVEGRVHGADLEGPATVGDEAARVLAEIAYKADAVLSWPDGTARQRFRLILGLGRASVHDPLRAITLAMDVLEALAGLSEDDHELVAVSLGASRGVVSTVRDIAGRLIRYEPVGRVLDVAGRLSATGRPGEVLVAGAVYRLVRRDFSFDDDFTREIDLNAELKQGPMGVRAYRLRGARTRSEREVVLAPGAQGLIGRGDEIRVIETNFEEMETTRRGVFLAVTGDLGVGKTSLVAAALDKLAPARVLRVECPYGMAQVPFETAAELIRAACQISDDTSPERVRAKVRGLVRSWMGRSEEAESVFRGLRLLVSPVQADQQQEEGQDRGTAISRAVRSLLSAPDRPLVVWVDALQWADGPTLELLGQLVQWGIEAPVLVVLSSRPEPRVERMLASVPKIELGMLGETERRAVIRGRLEGAQIPPEVEQAIAERAGGNPFFLIELVEALVDRGAIRIEGSGDERRVVRTPGVAISLPTTLEDAIAVRLGQLPEAERHAIRWLAAVGPGFRAEELSRIASSDLASSLQALEKRELVERRQHDTYTFPSAVIRHVAYETTDEGDRVKMHKRIGGFLSAMGPSVPPARIARHLERAGDAAAAADAYLKAAQAARLVYSNREALRFYTRALALLPPESPRRFRAHEARDQILRGMGRRQEQELELEAMRAYAEQTRQPNLLALAYNRLARYQLDGGSIAGVDALLARALDSAVQADDRGAEVEALRLGALLAREHGDTQRALDACDKALARAGFDRELLAARGSVLIQRGIILRRVGRFEEAQEANAEAFVIFRRLGIKRNEAQSLNAFGVVLASIGDYEDAITLIRQSIALDGEIGDRFHLGIKVSNVGQLYAELGDHQRAFEFLRRALDVFDSVGDQTGRCDTLTAMAETVLDSESDVIRARQWLDTAHRLAVRTGDRYDLTRERIVRACVELRDGDPAQAEGCAREALEVAEAAGIAGYRLLAAATLAEAQARAGHLEEARATASELRGRVQSSGQIERSDRIHLSMAHAFALAGDHEAAHWALAVADRLLLSRSAQIRDPSARERYLGTRTAVAIRRGLGG